MAAMLNGAAVMDAALLIIGQCKCLEQRQSIVLSSIILAANETCPKTQTTEHLAAMEIMKLNSIIILQTKIDLIEQVQVEDNYEQIQRFVQGSIRPHLIV